MALTTLQLVRHAQSRGNAGHLCEGFTDSDLSVQGLIELTKLTETPELFAGVSEIYCSNLLRARRTASAIAGVTRLSITELPDLRERNFGEFEGISWIDLYKIDRDLVERCFCQPDVAPPGGESRDQMVKRTLRCLQLIVSRHVGETVLVVTHGGPIRAALHHWTGATWATLTNNEPANASVITLTVPPRIIADSLIHGLEMGLEFGH